jgi:hypothetical protein
LVRDSDRLDLNFTYWYLLLRKHFSETRTVSAANDNIAGFVTDYSLVIQVPSPMTESVSKEAYGGKGWANHHPV